MKKILAILASAVLAVGTALAQEQTFASFIKSYENTPGCTYMSMQGEGLKMVAKQFNVGPAFQFLIGYENTSMHMLNLNRAQLGDAKWEELRQGAINFLVDGTYLSVGKGGAMEFFIQRDEQTVYALFGISQSSLCLFETNIPYADLIAAAQAHEQAQAPETPEEPKPEPEPTAEEEEPIPYQLVEEQPSFLGGGIQAFDLWAAQNVVYPEIAKENGISGTVYVMFTIGADGVVRNAKVIRGVDPALDHEAVRVVMSSPKWTPGKQNGKPVNVTYTYKILFQLK
ncbi:MAG: TonB family protein [Bacteroidales bacterium]|nr:TonB family protein [Bacteroidales bacterium]